MMTFVYVFIGGGLGSLARFGLSKLFSQSSLYNFPLGTFISNIVACIILAIIVLMVNQKSISSEWLQPLLIIGFCGGFSTFSTFSNETVILMHQGSWGVALANILMSVGVGLGVIYWVYSRSN